MNLICLKPSNISFSSLWSLAWFSSWIWSQVLLCYDSSSTNPLPWRSYSSTWKLYDIFSSSSWKFVCSMNDLSQQSSRRSSVEYILLQCLWKVMWNSFNEEILEGVRDLYQSRASPPNENINNFMRTYSWYISNLSISLWNSNKCCVGLSPTSSLKLGRISSQTLMSGTTFVKPKTFVKSKGSNLAAIRATKELDILKPVESPVNHVESSNQGVARWMIRFSWMPIPCSPSRNISKLCRTPGKI